MTLLSTCHRPHPLLYKMRFCFWFWLLLIISSFNRTYPYLCGPSARTATLAIFSQTLLTLHTTLPIHHLRPYLKTPSDPLSDVPTIMSDTPMTPCPRRDSGSQSPTSHRKAMCSIPVQFFVGFVADNIMTLVTGLIRVPRISALSIFPSSPHTYSVVCNNGAAGWLSRYNDCLQAGRSGIESRWGRDFPHLSRPALRPTQLPVRWVPDLSWG